MKKFKIQGVIGWDALASNLDAFLASAKGDDVEITISSPGGLVGEGLDMFNSLKNYSGHTKAILSGYAMSAASYVAMAAKEVVAESNATFMIHNAQGLAVGDHNTMDKTAGILKGLSAILAEAYAAFTGKERQEIREMMNSETWLFGSQIVEEGFAHGSSPGTTSNGDNRDARTAEARMAFGAMMAKCASNKTLFYNDLSRAATALGATGAMPKETRVQTESIEQQAKNEWNRSADIRDEFVGSFETYLAYKKDIPGIKVRECHGRGCTIEKVNPTNF